MDYNIIMGPLIMRGVPVTVNVTLLSDGLGGEGTEEIFLTLDQRPPFDGDRVLVNAIIRIIVRDNDSRFYYYSHSHKTRTSCSYRELKVCKVKNMVCIK